MGITCPGSTSNLICRRIETIAWASAQIHCFCCVNDSRVVLSPALLKSKFHQSSSGKLCFEEIMFL